MIMLKQRMLEVDGARLEVFLGGDHGPLVVDTHPLVTYIVQMEDCGTPLWSCWQDSVRFECAH